MQLQGQPSMYAAFDGSMENPIRVGSPDDSSYFVSLNGDALFSEAREGFQAYGRGILLLKDGMPGFVQTQYGIPDPGDFDRLGSTAWEDFEGYDPQVAMLVGVIDREGQFIGFWCYAVE